MANSFLNWDDFKNASPPIKDLSNGLDSKYFEPVYEEDSSGPALDLDLSQLDLDLSQRRSSIFDVDALSARSTSIGGANNTCNFIFLKLFITFF